MVLESNRDLVLRRLVECLGRDRTRHQVAEVTSLGLVQMTRKRIGTGLLEAFSRECEHCKGRGLVVHDHPVEPSAKSDDDEPRGRRSRGGRNRGRGGSGNGRPRRQRRGSVGHAVARGPGPLPPARAGRRPARPSPIRSRRPRRSRSRGASAPRPRPRPSRVGGSLDRSDGDAAESESSRSHAESSRRAGAGGAPSAPRVVTSTRRRTARRPAGPPAATEPPRPLARPGAGRSRRSPSAEPVDVPVEPAVPGHAADASPDEPRGTTRPDRHAAARRHARPAGDRGGRHGDPRRSPPGRTR